MKRGKKNIRSTKKKKKLQTFCVTKSLLVLGMIKISKRNTVSKVRTKVPGLVEPLPLTMLLVHANLNHPAVGMGRDGEGKIQRNFDLFDLYI